MNHEYKPLISVDEFIEFINHPLAYEQRLVNLIGPSHKHVQLNSPQELYQQSPETYTIKVESMERYSKPIFDYGQQIAYNYGILGRPITCHAFYARVGSPSFPLHTDPDDVFIHCVDGVKCIEIEEIINEILPGETLYIPANTPHRAINKYDSLMLSFAIEYFMKDKM